MGNMGRDLRVGARMLVKSPGFAAVVLITVALGVGANTAIFSVINAVLLRPLPYAEPGRLVRLYQTLQKEGVTNNGVSFLNYSDWAAQVRSFDGLGAVRMHDFTLTGQGDPVLVVAGTVTSNVFGILGSRPLMGRGLVPTDDAPDAAPVAVLSEKLWRERFGADRDVLGKTVQLDQRPFTVVGVMPAIFLTPPNVPPAELWTPLSKDPVFADLQQRRGGHYLTIVGRLKNGVAIPQAQAELATIQQGLAREYPKENEGWGVRIVPLSESLISGVRTALLLLLGAVAFVFLIACANVANLLLARASGRSREFAIRTALGAGRAAIVAQSLAESLLLALAGGVLGVALAYAATGALRAWLPPDLPRVGQIEIDASVLVFSFVASLLAAAVFGLAPALQSSSAGVAGALKEGSAGSGESRGKKRLRGVIVAAETAFAFVLLVGAGLLAKSFSRLQSVSLGFDPSHILTAGMSLPRNQYSKPEQWLSFYTTLAERLEGKPGVEGVAASLPLPLYGAGLNFGFKIEGRAETPGADLSANYTSAMPDYFRLLKIPLLQGRLFTERDGRESPRVCVISETFAKRHFPGESPIGRRLVFGFKDSVSHEIVGVVGDVKRDGLAVVSRPEMYVPFVQEPFWAAYVVIRTSGDPMALERTLRSEVAALDPAMPTEGIQPMTRIVHESVAQPRFRTTLLGLFGGLALVLAVIGIYGVISYSVGRRKREVGIRMALGAERGDVIRLVLGEGLALTGAGLAVGAVGAALLTKFLATLLYDVGRLDAPTYVAAALTLAAAGVLASWLPARRAMRVDPVRALREE